MDIQHILFPYDFSPHAIQVVPFVRALAKRLNARVTLFSVVPPTFETMPSDMGARVGTDVTGWTRELKSRLDATLIQELAEVQVERLADAGDPALRIAHFAHRHDVDLIMMPTHGLSLFRTVVVGSATARVLVDVTCPVWTAAHAEHQRARDLPKTILCALDGTPANVALLQWAADFSAHIGATLTLLHVVSPITDWPTLEREQVRQDHYREQARAQMEAILKSSAVPAPLRVAVGDIAATVAEDAQQEDADLIVIGRGSVQSPLGHLRTHAHGIIQRSRCPVLSVGA